MPTTSPYARELATAIEVVVSAGAALAEEAARASHAGSSASKLDIDLALETAIVEALHDAFPQDGILAEEGTDRPGGPRRWVLDPHDGTRDFSAGARETSISLALEVAGRPVLGVVHAPCASAVADPELRPLFGSEPFLLTWAEGEVLRRNGRPVVVARGPETLTPQSTVLVSRRLRGTTLETNRRALAPAHVLPCASIATRLALVACGAVAAAYTIGHPLAPWDYLGGQALLRGAGAALLDGGGLPVAPARDAHAYVAAGSLALATLVVHRLRAAFPAATLLPPA